MFCDESRHKECWWLKWGVEAKVEELRDESGNSQIQNAVRITAKVGTCRFMKISPSPDSFVSLLISGLDHPVSVWCYSPGTSTFPSPAQGLREISNVPQTSFQAFSMIRRVTMSIQREHHIQCREWYHFSRGVSKIYSLSIVLSSDKTHKFRALPLQV